MIQVENHPAYGNSTTCTDEQCRNIWKVSNGEVISLDSMENSSNTIIKTVAKDE